MPAEIAEANIRHLCLDDFPPTDYYRHDSYKFYGVAKDLNDLNWRIIEVLSGDHPARLSRAIQRIDWGGCTQDRVLGSITATPGVDILVLPSHSKVSTPYGVSGELQKGDTITKDGPL